MEFLAYAKINLALRVTGVRGGYHELDMVNTAISLADRIEFLGVKDSEVRFLRGTVAPPDCTHHAFAAAEGMARITGERGFRFSVIKNIPDRAGLGGSAAEAAGIIRAICSLYRIALTDERITKLAREIGSDVCGMLHTGYTHVRGLGGDVTPILSEKKLYFAIAATGVVSTAQAFLGAELSNGDNMRLIAALEQNGDLSAYVYNELTAPAVRLCPEIGGNLTQLKNLGARAVGMTGSGAACFGIFDTEEEAERAASRVKADFACAATNRL